MAEAGAPSLTSVAAVRFASLAALWWLIAGGEAASWSVGLPAVAFATWAAGRLGNGIRVRVSVLGLLRFLPFFLWESLRGATDVARRTLAPRMRIRPGFTRYRAVLPHRSARNLFANCVSLLPGTLAVDILGERLEVHYLNERPRVEAELARLERAVARVFPHREGTR
jgi:multicomponent Na+:H+ antiporter subunit E